MGDNKKFHSALYVEQLFAAPCWQVLNLTNKREEEEGEQWIFLFRGIVW